MIRITYWKKYNRVTATGHALSDEPGRDLVCSGASTLLYTLAANVASLEENGCLRDMSIRMDPGDCEISCVPGSRFRSVTELVFSTVCLGFELMARDHSSYITVEIRP